MTINEELREKAIKEYLEETEKRVSRGINYSVNQAVLVMAVIYGIVFAAIAFKDYFAGRYVDGVEVFGIGMAVSLLFLFPACLFTWAVLRKRASKDLARTEEELRKTVYTIEDDSLVRKVDGDGRRTKRYKLEQIGRVIKDGFIVTFMYGSEEVEFLDFYEPSLFDSLSMTAGRFNEKL